MNRTIAGAVFLLLLLILMRGSWKIRGIQPLDGMCTPSADSCGAAPDQRTPVDSLSRKPGPASGILPGTFIRHPLAFLSRAPADSLILLKGIGPVLAERIVVARNGKGPFSSWEDILAVKGIGPKKLESLKAQAGVIE